MDGKFIINFAPTGIVPTKTNNPSIPISINEIIEEVHNAYDVGITVVHLHARDENGFPTSERSYYEKLVEEIRKFCPDLVVCVSLSGRRITDFDKRVEPLYSKPDMASLTLSSHNFAKEPCINYPQTIIALAEKIKECGVKPELEVFDLGMLNAAKYLIKKELITPPYYFNLIFGNLFGMQPELNAMDAAIKELPTNSYWSFGGLGSYQLKSNVIAMLAGGGVRIGLEDNLFFDTNKKILANNIQLLKRIHVLANIFELKTMSCRDFGNLGFYRKSSPSGS
jgi:3-keto-5-aminohexanoate cleavage enzyme